MNFHTATTAVLVLVVLHMITYGIISQALLLPNAYGVCSIHVILVQ